MRQKDLSGSIHVFSLSSVLFNACYLIQGFIVIKLMEPALMGLWMGLQLIYRYGIHFHFGLINAVNRQVPFHRGRGELERARHIEKTARANLLLISAIVLVLLIIVCALLNFEKLVTLGIFCTGLATIIALHIHFYLGLYKARQEFGKAGFVLATEACVLIVGLPLVYLFSFYGLCGRILLMTIMTLFIALLVDKFSFGVAFDFKETKYLVRTGFPILIVGYLIVLLNTMDRILILVFLDRVALGHYSICIAASSVIILFPSIVGQIYYPKMVESYAREGINSSLISICVKASLLGGFFAGIVSGGLYLSLPWIVNEFFEKYIPGIPATRVALIGFFILAFGGGPNYFLIATVQKRRQLIILLAATAVMFIAGSYLHRFGLVGIAWSVVIAFTLYICGLWILVFCSPKERKEDVLKADMELDTTTLSGG